MDKQYRRTVPLKNEFKYYYTLMPLQMNLPNKLKIGKNTPCQI